jgi:hypothetical protein
VVANLPPVSTTPGVNLPPVVHLDLRIYERISQKIETALFVKSGAGGNMIEKTRSKKSRGHCPFKDHILPKLQFLCRFGSKHQFRAL